MDCENDENIAKLYGFGATKVSKAKRQVFESRAPKALKELLLFGLDHCIDSWILGARHAPTTHVLNARFKDGAAAAKSVRIACGDFLEGYSFSGFVTTDPSYFPPGGSTPDEFRNDSAFFDPDDIIRFHDVMRKNFATKYNGKGPLEKAMNFQIFTGDLQGGMSRLYAQLDDEGTSWWVKVLCPKAPIA